MDPLTAAAIRGNWATLLLPIDDNDAIDYNRLEAEIDFLIAAGVDGIYANGTAGEFYNLTEEEFDDVSCLLAAKCNAAGMPFQIGVSHMSPMLSLNRLKRVTRFKPGAVQVILPDWFVVTDDEAVSFLRRMAEHSDGIGLVLYNPPHAKRVLAPQDFQILKKHVPQLVGIKVAAGDDDWYRQMNSCCAGLSVFVPGHFLATGYSRGAHGAYSNVACLNPQAAQQWYQLMQHDLDAAVALEKRINRFLEKHIKPLLVNDRYSNQAVDKLLAAIGGWGDVGTRLRWPYRWLPAAVATALRPPARALIPEFFA